MEWKTKIPLTSVICCVHAQWGGQVIPYLRLGDLSAP